VDANLAALSALLRTWTAGILSTMQMSNGSGRASLASFSRPECHFSRVRLSPTTVFFASCGALLGPLSGSASAQAAKVDLSPDDGSVAFHDKDGVAGRNASRRSREIFGPCDAEATVTQALRE
jgi:hypothetical protein